MKRTSPRLRTLSALVTLGCSLDLLAAATSHTEMSARLTKGVVAQPEGRQTPEGRFNADGSAAVLYSPDYKAPTNPASSPLASHSGETTKQQLDAAAAHAAYEYLNSRHAALGLHASELKSLSQSEVRATASLSVVRYSQKHDGLPVYGSDIAVTIAPDGKVLFVSNNSVPGLGSTAATPAIEPAKALAITENYLGIGGSATSDTSRMVYKSVDGRTHTVWQVKVSTWEALIDDQSGDVLRAEDKALYADGSGMVFNPDPLSSTRSKYGSPGYVDGNNANTPQLNAARVPVVLRGITFDKNRYSLKGPYAACVDFDAPRDYACPFQTSSTFDFARSDLDFDATNAYYHIDTYMRYVNEELGITAMPWWLYTGGVQFDPHGVNGALNAYYNPGSGQIAFGEGGVNAAQDADVVIHELGHGIHHWITRGGLSNREGLSEAVGDYLAAGYSRDFNQWTSSDPEYYWIANWYGHNPFWEGRVTNWHIGHSYPDNLGGDGHTAGQYFSSCNMVARDAIGGRAMDKVFLTGLSMTSANATQKDAAQAILTAANSLGYSADQRNAIADAYNRTCNYNVAMPR